ncbi:MAG TPA: YezD family protein [Opitutaceae bacterium]|nr:YezD family protein [Opitutaceae bacterium]
MKPITEQASLPEWLDIVRQKVEGLSYGVVQIVVHDRKVTQIERTEKTRLDSAANDGLRRRENY